MSLPPIDLAVFHNNGYVRKQCRVTSLWFWTSDSERETCGDTPEDEYTFIGAPLIEGFEQRGKALKDAMREAFLGFFTDREHARIEPYPVLARWRDDIHLTINGLFRTILRPWHSIQAPSTSCRLTQKRGQIKRGCTLANTVGSRNLGII